MKAKYSQTVLLAMISFKANCNETVFKLYCQVGEEIVEGTHKNDASVHYRGTWKIDLFGKRIIVAEVSQQKYKKEI